MTAPSDHGMRPRWATTRDPLFCTAAAVFGAAMWLLIPQVAGLWPERREPPATPEIDLICRETGEVFRLRATSLPAEHPRTGKATLVPAIRDARDGAWKPGPPPDIRQRQRRAAGGPADTTPPRS